MEFSAKQIAQYINGTIIGDENAKVHTFAKIEEGVPGSLTFLANPKYTHYIYDTKASIVLVNNDFEPEEEVKATMIKVENAYECLAILMNLYEQSKPSKTGISELAYIHPEAKVAEEVYLAPFVFIGKGATIGRGTVLESGVKIMENAQIGEDCQLYPNVVVYHDCRVGNRCVIHSGTVVGSDGFGFAPSETGYDKIPQIGIVQIEDDVEIGANTCIDRSTMGATIIHKGVKLDNLIQVAHNVEVGSNTVMAAQGGIAGSTKVGEWCMFGGQVGLAGHIHIGDQVKVGAQAGITSNVKPRSVIQGTPAIPARDFMKSSVHFRNFDKLVKQLDELEKKVKELENNK